VNTVISTFAMTMTNHNVNCQNLYTYVYVFYEFCVQNIVMNAACIKKRYIAHECKFAIFSKTT